MFFDPLFVFLFFVRLFFNPSLAVIINYGYFSVGQ